MQPVSVPQTFPGWSDPGMVAIHCDVRVGAIAEWRTGQAAGQAGIVLGGIQGILPGPDG